MPRIPITTIYIVCEGKNTEPIYFERIKEEIEDENFLAITIYPDRSEKSHNSDPIGLIDEAIENKSNYDEVWVIYDKDGYTKHREAFEKLEAHKDKITLVFSSIAFETWVLLHFEKCSTAFSKSANIIEQKFIGGSTYLPTYEKKGAFDLYPLIKGKTRDALINSAWLKYIQASNLEASSIYEINPITNVDTLVKRLYNIDENIFFIGREKSKIIDLIEFQVSIYNDVKILEISNHDVISITTNEFTFSSDEKSDSRLLEAATLIVPQASLRIEFTKQNNVILKFRFNTVYLCFA